MAVLPLYAFEGPCAPASYDSHPWLRGSASVIPAYNEEAAAAAHRRGRSSATSTAGTSTTSSSSSTTAAPTATRQVMDAARRAQREGPARGPFPHNRGTRVARYCPQVWPVRRGGDEVLGHRRGPFRPRSRSSRSFEAALEKVAAGPFADLQSRRDQRIAKSRYRSRLYRVTDGEKFSNLIVQAVPAARDLGIRSAASSFFRADVGRAPPSFARPKHRRLWGTTRRFSTWRKRRGVKIAEVPVVWRHSAPDEGYGVAAARSTCFKARREGSGFKAVSVGRAEDTAHRGARRSYPLTTRSRNLERGPSPGVRRPRPRTFLIVDDSSPDGTGEIADSLRRDNRSR